MTGLTKRQNEIVQALLDGHTTYKLIASHLGISWQAVRAQFFRIYQRLGLHNKNQVILWAMEHGYTRRERESQDGAGLGNGQ